MTPQEMNAINAYRLTSLEEPTDEMLATLMNEAATEATRRARRATVELFERIAEKTRQRREQWEKKMNQQNIGTHE